jgi:hypothetical protein
LRLLNISQLRQLTQKAVPIASCFKLATVVGFVQLCLLAAATRVTIPGGIQQKRMGHGPKMLQTVKDACKFDPKAIDYALSDQIENLDDLIGHDPKSAEAFFSKTYVTGGMKTLLRQGLQRLSGTSGQAVFELKQAMGGGKTHSMLALGYLAANPKLFGLIAKDITQDIKAEPAQVVAISGRSISRDKHLWGDIASQLGKADKFLGFYKGAPIAPNEKDWVDLIGDTPTLILLDELPCRCRGFGAGSRIQVWSMVRPSRGSEERRRQRRLLRSEFDYRHA